MNENEPNLEFKLKYAFYPTPFKNPNLPPHLPGFVFSKNQGTPDPEIPIPAHLDEALLTGPAFISHGCHYDYEPVDVINILTSGKKNIHYLEIGVDQGNTFNNVENVSLKHGVDPYGACKNITHKMTSQLFFVMNKRFFNQKYDIIFIDGMHLSEFIWDEVIESLKILNDDGFIILHDTCPRWEPSQLVLEEEYKKILNTVISPSEKKRLHWHEIPWDHHDSRLPETDMIGYNGDAWKLLPYLRAMTGRSPINAVFSIPNACVTIISKKRIIAFEHNEIIHMQELPAEPEMLTYAYYYENFERIMNPFTMDYFKENINET